MEKVYAILLRNEDDDYISIHSLWTDKDRVNQCIEYIRNGEDAPYKGYIVEEVREYYVYTKETGFAPFREFIFKRTGELVRCITGGYRIEDRSCWTHKYNDVIPHDPEIGGCISVCVGVEPYEKALEFANTAKNTFINKLESIAVY